MIPSSAGSTARVYVMYASLDVSRAKMEATVEAVDDAGAHARGAGGGPGACRPQASGPCEEMLAAISRHVGKLSSAAEQIVTATGTVKSNFETADPITQGRFAP